MGVIWHNDILLGTLLEDVPQEIDFDRWGIAGATLNYQTKFELAVGLIQNITNHPDYVWLLRKSAKIRREEADLAKVAITFEGIPPQTDYYQYELQASTTTEDITAHPKWVSVIGGTPTSPRNGAIFVQGKFQFFQMEFPAGSGTLNPKAGVKSYLSPSIVYVEKHTSGDPSSYSTDLSKIGNIDTPTTSSVSPSDLNGRTWLMIGGEAIQIGLGTQTNRRWRLSGKRGWDTDIYNP